MVKLHGFHGFSWCYQCYPYLSRIKPVIVFTVARWSRGMDLWDPGMPMTIPATPSSNQVPVMGMGIFDGNRTKEYDFWVCLKMVYVLSILNIYNSIPQILSFFHLLALVQKYCIAPGHFIHYIPLKRLRRHVWEIFLLFSWHLLLCCKAPPKESETSLKGTPGSPIWERLWEIWGIEKGTYHLPLYARVVSPCFRPFSPWCSVFWPEMDIAENHLRRIFENHPKFDGFWNRNPSIRHLIILSTTIHWLKTEIKSSHHLNVETPPKWI